MFVFYIYIFRNDGKSFAAISIRRRKKKREVPANFLNGNSAPKTIQTEESAPLIPPNFGTANDQL
jgi:hypothetical protein